jgi:hypothetical protein
MRAARRSALFGECQPKWWNPTGVPHDYEFQAGNSDARCRCDNWGLDRGERGRRISVVLVGEDSLEANVGHLGALTGGEIFVAAGADLVAAVESAVRSLKIPHQAAAPMGGSPQHVAVRSGGMTISARSQPADTAAGDALALRAVAAMAASLALPAMATESAAQLAEAEGLVTHLTSLILIDEAATQEASIPATRKVALPTPRAAEWGVARRATPVVNFVMSTRGLALTLSRSPALPISRRGCAPTSLNDARNWQRKPQARRHLPSRAAPLSRRHYRQRRGIEPQQLRCTTGLPWSGVTGRSKPRTSAPSIAP